jgi:hypothetical protein
MTAAPKATEAYIQRKKRGLIELRPAGPPKMPFLKRPLFLFLKSIVLPIGWAYRGLVGWWLGPLLASRTEKELRAEVKRDLGFLFEKYSMRFVPNDRKYKHGNVVTLENEKLRFEVSGHHGEYFLRVAPLNLPLDWEDVATVIVAMKVKTPINSVADFGTPPTWSDLGGLAAVLEPEVPHLEKALSHEHYEETIQVIVKMEEISRSEFIARWNKNVQFYRDHPDANIWNKKEPIQTLGIKDYRGR